MNKYIKKATPLLLIVFMLSSSTTASATAYLYKGGFSSAKSLKYCVAAGNNSYASTAISQWNGISKNVNITKTTNLGSAQILISADVILAPSSKKLGLTTMFYNSKKVSVNSIWTNATCVQYKNSKYLNTATKCKATLVHEIGHALSLAHPTSVSSSIMNQGVKTSYSLYSYDKNALKTKWD